MTSLAVSITNSSNYTGVLYLRDKIDPSALPAFPQLTPTVQPLSSPVDVPDGAWEQWIADIERAPTGAAIVEPGTPELARAFEEHRLEAARWVTEHADDGAIERYRPTWISELLAAKSGDGQFACEVLPVDGAWMVDVSPRRLLVSQATFGEHALMDRLLRERVVPLLT